MVSGSLEQEEDVHVLGAGQVFTHAGPAPLAHTSSYSIPLSAAIRFIKL